MRIHEKGRQTSANLPEVGEQLGKEPDSGQEKGLTSIEAGWAGHDIPQLKSALDRA